MMELSLEQTEAILRAWGLAERRDQALAQGVLYTLQEGSLYALVGQDAQGFYHIRIEGVGEEWRNAFLHLHWPSPGAEEPLEGFALLRLALEENRFAAFFVGKDPRLQGQPLLWGKIKPQTPPTSIWQAWERTLLKPSHEDLQAWLKENHHSIPSDYRWAWTLLQRIELVEATPSTVECFLPSPLAFSQSRLLARVLCHSPETATIYFDVQVSKGRRWTVGTIDLPLKCLDASTLMQGKAKLLPGYYAIGPAQPFPVDSLGYPCLSVRPIPPQEGRTFLYSLRGLVVPSASNPQVVPILLVSTRYSFWEREAWSLFVAPEGAKIGMLPLMGNDVVYLEVLDATLQD